MALAVIELNFAQVGCASLRRDGPQHIGEIFQAELCGFIDAIKLSIDLHAAVLALYARLAAGAGHEFGAAEVNFCSAAPVAVVDRLGGVRDAGGSASG